MITEDQIRILFTGDIVTVGAAESTPDKPYSLKVDESIKDVFLMHHLRICNLENPLTTSGNKILKTGPHLKAHPNSIKLLTDLNIDVACLSNNHIRDFGNDGVLDTIQTCKSNDIKTVGAGKNKEEAALPLYLEINGFKLAILNFSESEYNTSGADFAGSNPDDPIHLWKSMQLIKGKTDIVLVIMHGGREMFPYPTPYQVQLYRHLVDLGAHAVIGHHSHVIGGFEIYKNVPIIYSLGNFIFDDRGNPKQWYYGAIASLLIHKKNCIPEFYHTTQLNNTLKLIDHQNSETIKDKRFIHEVNLEEINSSWENLVKNRLNSSMHELLNSGRMKKILYRHGLLSLSEKDINFLMASGNRCRCNTHKIFTEETIKNIILERTSK